MCTCRACLTATTIPVVQLARNLYFLYSDTMDASLEALKRDIDNISLRQQILTAQVKDLEGFTKREAYGIEKEITLAVKKHLVNTIKSMKLYVPNGFPKKLYDPNTNSFLTDLDGAYILTDDPDVADFNDEISDLSVHDPPAFLKEQEKQKRSLERELSKPMRDYRKQLVIIEAKHYMTEERVKYKLDQLQTLHAYITAARSLSDPNEKQKYTSKFIKNVDMFKFDKYDENIILYLGAPYWDDKAIAYLKTQLAERPYLRSIIGIVMVDGSRYSVSSLAGQMQGGRRRTRK